MDATSLRLKLVQELELLPEEHLSDLYRLIHYFRLGLLVESPAQERQWVNGNVVSPEPTLPDPMDETVEREREAFIALHSTLLAHYPGEEVAIYQGQVVDHDKDGVALSSRIYQRFPHEFVWIAPVTDQPLEVRTVYSHRREPEWQ